MGKQVMRVLPNGDVQFIDTPEMAELKKEGKVTIRRASYVEPSRRHYRWIFHLLRCRFSENGVVAAFTRLWPVYWRVNLTLSNGPIYGQFSCRSEAINSEIEWLQRNVFKSSGPTERCSPQSMCDEP